MLSPAVALLAPELVAMTLLSWDATSSIRPTLEKRQTRRASQATALPPSNGAAIKQLRQLRLSCGEPRHEAPQSGDIYKALVASGIFSRTSPDAVSALSKRLARVRFAPGCVVDAQRDAGGRLYVIISGKVKVSYRLPDGSEIILTILGPSEIFGVIRLFDPTAQETSVTTLTDVLAAPIEHDQLRMWMVDHPEISDQLMRLFARWANATTNSLADFAFVDAQARIANRLLFLRKRFGRREGDVVRVVHDLTLKDFSRLVGVAPKTILATLSDFENRGWIRLEHNSVVVVDGQALASVSRTSFSEVSNA
ncbi:Crp/Fnr family transcriptional regulator [Mycobacterium heidelbergense]|uniref:Crp/Fnr family transcriptional regulator n=1 Tax=Mycobacterium heidelbergense TaxID=53376 RepID=UPI003CF5211B